MKSAANEENLSAQRCLGGGPVLVVAGGMVRCWKSMSVSVFERNRTKVMDTHTSKNNL